MNKGESDKKEQLKRKRAIWGENDKEICEEMDKYKKMKDLKIPNSVQKSEKLPT